MSSITILIRFSNMTSETLTLPGRRFIVGREEGDIVLGDPQVSWRHGEFVLDPGAGVLHYEDLGSSNGSFLANGQEISHRVRITPGQVVHIGNSVITVKGFDLAGPGEPARLRRDTGELHTQRPGNLTSPGWPAEQLLGDVLKKAKEKQAAEQGGAGETMTTGEIDRVAKRTRTKTSPQRALQADASATRSGVWYEVRARDPDPRSTTYVMSVGTGQIVIRVRSSTDSGYAEALTTCAGALTDFELVEGA